MKAKSIFIAFLLLLHSFTNILNAQQSTFTKVYYDVAGDAQGHSLIKTHDHKYMIAGYKDSYALAMKIDSSGNIIWSKMIASVYDSRFTSVIPTDDFCYLFTGTSPDANQEGTNVFCVKMNSTGDTLWTRSVDFGQSSYALTAQQTSDHGFIIAGFLRQITAPFTKIVVVKLDSLGIPQWNSILSSGNQDNLAYAIKQTSDGGYILTGDLGNYPPYESSVCMIRLTPAGTVSWAKKMYRKPTDYLMGLDVVVTSNGYLWYIDLGSNGFVILKTDFYGNVLWSRNYQQYALGYWNENSRPKLNATTDGGYVFTVAGWGFQPMIKIDSSGIIQWVQTMAIIATDVVESFDTGYMLLGNGPIMGVKMAPTDRPQIGIIKTDSLGNSSGCVMANWIAADTCTVRLASVTYTTTSGATLVPFHPAVTNAALSIFDGCVAITGSVADKNSGENVVTISPNPSNGIFYITVDHPGIQSIVKFEIYSVMGEKIYESACPNHGRLTVDLRARPCGIYFILAQISDKTYTQKILINR